MSALTSYREPAWRGLTAVAPIYEDADAQLSEEVMQVLGVRGSLKRIANIGDASSVFLRMDSNDSQALFLKVVTPDRGRTLSQAEDLAKWLHDCAIPVVASDRSCALSDGRRVWVYPFHDGRPPEARVSDMAMIGGALGKLHRELERHQLAGQWKQQTDARIQRLMKTREAVAQGTLRAGPDAPAFQKIANDRSIVLHPDMFVELGLRVPIHGDLNRFNMLINDSGCTFLDFEDVQHSVFPAVFDLATVVERVAAVYLDEQALTPCKQALLAAYQDERSDVDMAAGARALPAIQRSIALRSLCTLAETDALGLHVDEWAKFFSLLSLAEKAVARSAIGTFDS